MFKNILSFGALDMKTGTPPIYTYYGVNTVTIGSTITVTGTVIPWTIPPHPTSTPPLMPVPPGIPPANSFKMMGNLRILSF